MNENKNESNYRINAKAKKELYTIYTQLLSEINNKERLNEIHSNNSAPNHIFDNIKQLIPILMNQFKNQQKYSLNEDNDSNCINEQYEDLLRKSEEGIRHQYKIIFHQKIRINYLETKLNEYMSLAEEYKQMKKKFKYEEGKFLNDDRKENEIIILRSENSKIKTAISKLEKSFKDSESNCKKYVEKIGLLNQRIDNLNDSIIKLKQYCDVNSHSNTCYNTNTPTYNNNNQTLSSKVESKQRDEQYNSLGNIINEIEKNSKNRNGYKLKKRNQNNSLISMKGNNIIDEIQSTLSKKNRVTCKTVAQLVSNFKLLVKQKNIKAKPMSSISSLTNIIINKKKNNHFALRNRSVSTT